MRLDCHSSLNEFSYILRQHNLQACELQLALPFPPPPFSPFSPFSQSPDIKVARLLLNVKDHALCFTNLPGRSHPCTAAFHLLYSISPSNAPFSNKDPRLLDRPWFWH